MNTRGYDQRKTPQSSAFAPVKNRLQSRPFAVQDEVEESSPQQQQTPDLQKQLEKEERFGYNFSRVSVVAASTPAPDQPTQSWFQAKLNKDDQGVLDTSQSDNPLLQRMIADIQQQRPESNGGRVEPIVGSIRQNFHVQPKLAIGQPGDKYEQEAEPGSNKHIYLGEGKSPAKDALSAHERTQVVQQTGGAQLQAQLSNQEVQPITIANSQDGWVQRYPDTIWEAAQMILADSILRLSIDQVIKKKKDKNDLINEAFWTAYPQIKDKKINDKNVPDPEQKQTYIDAYMYIANKLYPKVYKEAKQTAQPGAEETESPLYGPWQDPKAYENWGANEKKKTPNDVVVPKPSNNEVSGLPENPQLEHPEFSAILQEMEKMEQNPLVSEEHHGEETGDARTKRVEKIAELRKRIAALGETISDVEASQIKNVQAYLYRRLAPLAPYFGQMANTNILEKGSKGWDRTCNVTVPAMVVEGIGKTKDDYDQSKLPLPLLKRIFNALEDKYKERKKHDAATDFDTLRLPDFMALIGIARWMPETLESLSDEEFVNAVSKARQTAASKTIDHATMMYLIKQFGGSPQSDSVSSSDLDKIGGAQKDYTKAKLRGQNPEQWRELYNEVEAGKKSFDELSKNEKKGYQTLWKYEQFNTEEADKLLSVDNYRKAVLDKVNPLLNKGAQILVGMENHFVRLDALDQDTIQVDDPGEKGFKNLQVTWEQGRNLGYFKIFWEITG
jgi:hypothetical protein